MEFFATAAKGTEPVLRDELKALRMPRVRCDRGGVHFGGEWEHGWQACLHSRVAMRIFAKLAEYEAPSAEALYDGARAVDWSFALSPRQTLAVSAYCRSSELTHSNFIALKIKDAIVDQIRDRLSERPDIHRQDPDVRVFVHLVKNQATLYLDLAGESLHRRAYRKHTGEAPLKETLAAALIYFSGWDWQKPFCDPMCGSGTIAIEAAMMAQGIVPGLARETFGFERWANFDQTARDQMKELRAKAQAKKHSSSAPIHASDIDPKVLQAAETNARNAGVDIQFAQQSVSYLKPFSPPGVIVSNPPYGKRLETDSDFYRELGNKFKGFDGHSICLLTGEKKVQHLIPLKHDRYQILFNGDIECWMLLYHR